MTTPAADLPETVRQLLSKIRRYLQIALDEYGLDLTPQEAHLLHLIRQQKDTTALDLTGQTGYDKAFVARKLNALAERDLISRHADAADKRRVKLRLTPRGKRCCETMERARQQAHQQVFGALTTKEQQQLTSLLGKCL